MIKKARVWKGQVMLLDGRIANVRDGRNHPFHNGFFAANEGPIKVEIREIRRTKGTKGK